MHSDIDNLIEKMKKLATENGCENGKDNFVPRTCFGLLSFMLVTKYSMWRCWIWPGNQDICSGMDSCVAFSLEKWKIIGKKLL